MILPHHAPASPPPEPAQPEPALSVRALLASCGAGFCLPDALLSHLLDRIERGVRADDPSHAERTT